MTQVPQPPVIKYAHVSMSNGVLTTVKTDMKKLAYEDQVVVALNLSNPVTARFIRYVDRPDHVTSLDKGDGGWIVQKIDMKRIDVLNSYQKKALNADKKEKLLAEMEVLQNKMVTLAVQLEGL
jgi:hypothetical protein